MIANQQFSNEFSPKIEKLAGEVFDFSNTVSQRTQNRHALHISVPIWSLSIFIFGNFPAKPPFFLTITTESRPVFVKGQSRKRSHSGFPERWIDYESHAIPLILRNGIWLKRFYLDQDRVWWIHCPVEMAIGHFPAGSHNFTQRGVYITMRWS